VRTGYALKAIALGLIGFAAIEIASRERGVLAALTPYLWLDAAVYAATSLLLALAFARAFRGSRRWALPFAVLGFVLAFAPLAALLAAAAELTLDGLWGTPGLVRGAFVHTPINLIYALVLDLGAVALPLGLVSATVLAWQARQRG
jgi:hypothetical protein